MKSGYIEKTCVQKLKGFKAVCPLCHEVIHFERAMVIGNEKRAFDRFKKINKLSKTDADAIIAAVWRQWQIRNHILWKLDIKHLNKYKIKILRKVGF